MTEYLKWLERRAFEEKLREPLPALKIDFGSDDRTVLLVGTPVRPSPMQDLFREQLFKERSQKFQIEYLGTFPQREPMARISVPDLSMIEQVGSLAADLARSMRGEDPSNSPQVREIEEQEWEVATRTQRTRRARTPGRATVSGPTTKNDPIFVWGMQSSKPRNGGHFIQYEVRLNDDGSLSCNCPGWVFKKKTETRGCKHTRHAEVIKDAEDFFKRHQRGEQLPLVAPTEEQMARAANTRAGQKAVETGKDPLQGFGRFIELEE